MKSITRWILCHVIDTHNWTCKANEGIKPNPKEHIWEYARMYCKHCGKESKLNYKP